MVPASSLWTVFGTSILPDHRAQRGDPAWPRAWRTVLGDLFYRAFRLVPSRAVHRIFYRRNHPLDAGKQGKAVQPLRELLMGKVDKHKGKIEKYGYLGVFIFVAIPLPGTGVWTGSLIASVLGLKPAKAIPLVILGNCVAGFIMLMLSSIFFPGMVPWAA